MKNSKYILILFLIYLCHGLTGQIVIELDFDDKKASYAHPIYGATAKSTTFLLKSEDGKKVIICEYEKLESTKVKDQGILTFSNMISEGIYTIDKIDLGENMKSIKVIAAKPSPLSIVDSDQTIELNLPQHKRFGLIFINSGLNERKIKTILPEIKQKGTGFVNDSIKVKNIVNPIAPGRSKKKVEISGVPAIAGEYSGKLTFIDDKQNEIPISIRMNVKDPMFWALVALILGLIIGFFTAVYNNNKDEITLFGKAKQLEKMVVSLPKVTGGKDALLAKVITFIESVGNPFDSIEKKRTDLQDLYLKYTGLRNGKGFNSLTNYETIKLYSSKLLSFFFYSVKPILIFLSACVLATIGFHELYCNNATFGDNMIPNYLTILLIGAASSSTLEIIFGKKYSEIKT